MAKIEMYVWDDCAYCRRAKEVLVRNGINISDSSEYIEHDITRNPQARVALQARIGADNPVTAPQVFVNNNYLGCCADLIDFEAAGTLAVKLMGIDEH